MLCPPKMAWKMTALVKKQLQPPKATLRKRLRPNHPVKPAAGKHLDVLTAEYKAMMVQIDADKDTEKLGKKDKELAAKERWAATRAKNAREKKARGSAKAKQADDYESTTKEKRKSQKQKNAEQQKIA